MQVQLLHNSPGWFLPFFCFFPLAPAGAGPPTLNRRVGMTALGFSAVVFTIAAAAGFLGSLTGLGGGVVVTPALTIFLGVDIHFAMGASLVSVIATSSGAAAAYVKEGFSNIRAGMFLEIATTLGAVAGAHLTSLIPASALAIVFGAVLLYSAWHSFAQRQEPGPPPSDPLAA